MSRTFQTFEEWFQSDLKRMRNRTRWNYPQVPVYKRHYKRDINNNIVDDYHTMTVKYRDTEAEVRNREYVQ